MTDWPSVVMWLWFDLNKKLHPDIFWCKNEGRTPCFVTPTQYNTRKESGLNLDGSDIKFTDVTKTIFIRRMARQKSRNWQQLLSLNISNTRVVVTLRLTASRPVSLGVGHLFNATKPDLCCGFFYVGRPLWREDVFVFYRGHSCISFYVISRSVRTSQETHYVSATKPNRLMLFRKIIDIYCEKNKRDKNKLCRLLVC
jgi:hypothetical protein